MATHSTAARNAATDAVLALIGTSGNFKFRLAGIVAAPGTAVATLPFSATAFGASSSGTATANAITDDSSATGNASPVATGTFETSGGTIVVQCTVGVSGEEVNIPSGLTIPAGSIVGITALTYTALPS